MNLTFKSEEKSYKNIKNTAISLLVHHLHLYEILKYFLIKYTK